MESGGGARSTRAIARLVAAVALSWSLPVAGLASSTTASAAVATPGLTRLIRTADVVRASVNALRAGDTLLLAPGTYSTGWLVFYGGVGGPLQGTASAPITITSADPTHPAVLVGGLAFLESRFLHVTNLKVIAGKPTAPALLMQGGADWRVSNCEFTGARATGGLGNVVITGANGEPSNFAFVGNRVHTAALAAPGTHLAHIDHNIYVSYAGAPGAGGVITNNILWDAPNGENIKIGRGGLPSDAGPWNLVVAWNTMVNAGHQVVMTGILRNITVSNNLFYRSTQTFNTNSGITQIYLNFVRGTGFSVVWNYSFGASMLLYDPTKVVRAQNGNTHSNSTAYNPRFVGGTRYRPTNPKAARAGAYARAWSI